MNWTDEKIELLKKLWNDGLSSKQIAIKFETTRNSIIGKVHRLGLEERRSVPKADSLKEKISATKKPSDHKGRVQSYWQTHRLARLPGKVKIEEVIEEVNDGLPGVHLINLRHHHCRWIIDECALRYCGKRRTRGSFCTEHAKKAYTGKSNHVGKRSNPKNSGRTINVVRPVD